MFFLEVQSKELKFYKTGYWRILHAKTAFAHYIKLESLNKCSLSCKSMNAYFVSLLIA